MSRAEGNDGQLNTEVIVRGIVVPGYSYVNLDQASLLEVKEGTGDGGEGLEGVAEGGRRFARKREPARRGMPYVSAPTNICTG